MNKVKDGFIYYKDYKIPFDIRLDLPDELLSFFIESAVEDYLMEIELKKIYDEFTITVA